MVRHREGGYCDWFEAVGSDGLGLVWRCIPHFAGMAAFPFRVGISISSLHLYEEFGTGSGK